MSNNTLEQLNTNTEDSIMDKGDDFNSTSNLRSSDMSSAPQSIQPVGFKVKQAVKKEEAQPAAAQEAAAPKGDDKIYSAADIVRIAKEIEHNVRKSLAMSGYVPGATQTMPKDKAPELVVDFSKLTLDDIYDFTIPIQAKPFGATDALRVELVDKNYEARWVNKNPRRLGQFLAWGFTYVEEADLARSLEVEVTADAQGHFSLDDVVLMRIPKPEYFAALRAAHERAVRTVNSVHATNAAKQEANAYMSKVGGTEFANAAAEGKIDFYKPGIEI